MKILQNEDVFIYKLMKILQSEDFFFFLSRFIVFLSKVYAYALHFRINKCPICLIIHVVRASGNCKTRYPFLVGNNNVFCKNHFLGEHKTEVTFSLSYRYYNGSCNEIKIRITGLERKKRKANSIFLSQFL